MRAGSNEAELEGGEAGVFPLWEDSAAFKAQEEVVEEVDWGEGRRGADSARFRPPDIDFVAARRAFCRPSEETFLSVMAGGDFWFWIADEAAVWPWTDSGALQTWTGAVSLCAAAAA